MADLFTELKRRNVFRVGFAYVVMAWLLAQITDLVVDNVGAPEWVMKIILLVLALGFPIALFFAWAFEITPEGIKREHDVDRSESITHQTGQRLNNVIIAAIAIAVMFLLFDRFSGQQPEQRAESGSAPAVIQNEEISIAVLPFVNISSDPEQEYFSDGISEEILNLLVRVEGLSVASRTSAFSFKGSSEKLSDIADALRVDHILEGSVRKSNDRVRITAQLIDAKRDRHLWSDTFDRELTDIFAIQDEISGAIVEALRTTLGVQIEKSVSASVATTNMGAYQVYLKARELFFYRNPLGLRQSIELFHQAIEMDPEFARAYEGLAAVMVVISGYRVAEEIEPLSREESDARAEKFAMQALEIDPSLSLPHAVMGLVFLNRHDYELALREFELSIGLDDRDATALLWRGIWSLNLGYLEDSLENLHKAQKLDPDTGIYNDFLGTALYLQGRHEEGLQFLATGLERGRRLGLLPFFLGLETGGRLAAITAVTPFLSDDESTLVPYFMRIFDESVDREKARQRFLTELGKKPEIAKAVYRNADFLILLGEYERAVDVFSASVGSAWARVWWPYNYEFRQTQYFKTVIRNRNMDTYWRKHSWPDLCRPVGDDDFECD